LSRRRIACPSLFPAEVAEVVGQVPLADAAARLMRTRRTVETAIGKLSDMFAAQTTKARDLRSFVNRMARKLLAYNLSLIAA
jgi:hypothetical protein